MNAVRKSTSNKRGVTSPAKKEAWRKDICGDPQLTAPQSTQDRGLQGYGVCWQLPKAPCLHHGVCCVRAGFNNCMHNAPVIHPHSNPPGEQVSPSFTPVSTASVSVRRTSVALSSFELTPPSMFSGGFSFSHVPPWPPVIVLN